MEEGIPIYPNFELIGHPAIVVDKPCPIFPIPRLDTLLRYLIWYYGGSYLNK